MNKTKIVAFSVVGIGLLVAALSLILPRPAGTNFISFNINFGISMAMAEFYLGAAFLFSRGLKDFTPRLKRAYVLLCVGIALFAIAEMQIPLFIFFGAQDKFVGFSILPVLFAAAIIVLFIGTRSLASLFNIKNLSTTWWIGPLLFVVLAGIAVVLPHATYHGPEYKFDGESVSIFFMAVLLALGSAQLLYVKRVASSLFTNAFAWMFLGLVTIALTGITHFTFTIIAGDASWYVFHLNPALIPGMFAIAALCMLRSAYSFNMIAHTVESAPGWTARTFFGKPLHKEAGQAASSVDIVTYAANLASDSRALDVTLDSVRRITSRLGPDQKLSADDEEVLLKTYLQIEHYLLTKEKVRVFQKDALRQSIAQGLRLTQEHPTFWNRLPA